MNQHLLDNAAVLIDKAKFEKFLENAETREDIIKICEKYLQKHKPLKPEKILVHGAVKNRTLQIRETIPDYVFEDSSLQERTDYVNQHVIRNMCKDVGKKILEEKCYTFHAEKDWAKDATHYVMEVIIGEKQ